MITIIAAIGKNNELGKDNQLLWHLPEDLKYFKKMTYEDISTELDIHIRTAYRMRNNILSALELHFKTQRLIDF